MDLAPALWLFITLALALRRPGLVLGAVFSANMFETYYNVPALGAAFLLSFLAFIAILMIFQWRSTPFFIPEVLLGIFALGYVLSPLYAFDITSGMAMSGRFLVVCIGYYFAGRVLCAHEKYCDRLIVDFGISVVILTLLFGYLGLSVQLSSGRLGVGDGSAVAFAQLIDIAFAFCLFYFIGTPAKLGWTKKAAALAAFGLIGYIGVLNATRGTVLSLTIAASAFGVMLVFVRGDLDTRLSRLLLLGFAVLAVGVIVVQLLIETTDDRLAYGIARLIQNFGPSGYKLDASSAERLELLRSGWELFLSAPIFGHGAGSYSVLTSQNYPHNLFVELLAETGLIMTILFGVILMGFWNLGVNLLKLTNFSTSASILVGFFLVSVVHQQVSGAFWMAKTIFFSMGAIAALYARALSAQKSKRKLRDLMRTLSTELR